eukprot:1058201-Pleurochrysis_carterae.AAC.1
MLHAHGQRRQPHVETDPRLPAATGYNAQHHLAMRTAPEWCMRTIMAHNGTRHARKASYV